MGYFAKRTASAQQIDVGVSRCAVAGAYKGDSFADDMRTRFLILYDTCAIAIALYRRAYMQQRAFSYVLYRCVDETYDSK